MRIAGKLKCGFYPLPLTEAEAIKNCLEFPLRRVFSSGSVHWGRGGLCADHCGHEGSPLRHRAWMPIEPSKLEVWSTASFKGVALTSTVRRIPSHCST